MVINPVITKFIGIIIISDGILSFLLVKDRKFLWQLGRLIRIFLGILLLVIK